MTIIDEKEILEVEKLKMELKYGPKAFTLKFYSAMLATATVAVFVTKYFTGA